MSEEKAPITSEMTIIEVLHQHGEVGHASLVHDLLGLQDRVGASLPPAIKFPAFHALAPLTPCMGVFFSLFL